MSTEGEKMHALATRLFPICRSITGNGVRETLRILGEYIPLKIVEVPTGTVAFDWTVPKEWNIRDAYVADAKGNKVIDFKQNNLHVVGYSIPIDREISYEELQEHLHSIPEQPDAIPYITSYYKEQWGFCMADSERQKLGPDAYHVYIDSTLATGSLTYGELVIPGNTSEEIFISTYICHPSMANNELSGPVVTTAIAKWITSAPRKYTYRIIFIPETIGSIVYLSTHADELQKRVIAGFNVTCVGDDRAYSFIPSRYGNTLADKIALRVLNDTHPEFKAYSYLDRGSDERQYCSPGVDLPVVSIMRSKYYTYPEYHTSLDDLKLITPAGLQGSFDLLKECINRLESVERYRSVFPGEPQLGKRGLYPQVSTKATKSIVANMLNVLTYCDGTNDVDELSALAGVPVPEIQSIIENLKKNGLVKT